MLIVIAFWHDRNCATINPKLGCSVAMPNLQFSYPTCHIGIAGMFLN